MSNQNKITAVSDGEQKTDDFDDHLYDIQRRTNENYIIIHEHESQKRIKQIQEERGLELAIRRARQDLEYIRCRLLSTTPTSPTFFPERVFPPKFSEFVFYVSEVVGWSHLPVALCILTLLASAMRGRYLVNLEQYWQQPVVLFLFLCSPYRNMTSSLLDMLLPPFLAYEASIQKEYAKELSKMTARITASRMTKEFVQRRTIKAKIKEYDTNGSEEMRVLLKNVQDYSAQLEDIYNEATPQLPVMPQILSRKPSFKNLHRTMAEQGGGTSIFQGDGNYLLTLLNTPKAKLDIFTKAYDFESIGYESKKGDPLLINNTFINMVHIINPDVARQLYSSERVELSGLASLAMIFFVKEVMPGSAGHKEGELLYQEYSNKVTSMLQRNYSQSGSREIFKCTVSQGGYRKLKNFQLGMHEVTAHSEHDRPLSAYWWRQPGLAARLAAVLHAWHSDEPEKTHISEEDVESACSIVDCIATHGAYAFSPCGIQAYYNAEKIFEWIKRHKFNQFTNTEVAQGVANMRNSNIFPALDALEEINIIRQIVTKKQRICVVHPSIWR